jgi:hypothetical protein
MAADGKIDEREVNIIRTMCEASPYFEGFDHIHEINHLVNMVNENSNEFFQHYFTELENSVLSEEEELTVIDFSIKTINADDTIEYQEIKIFKNIRHRLSVSNESILTRFPNIDYFIEEDIASNSNLSLLAKEFLENASIPNLELLKID